MKGEKDGKKTIPLFPAIHISDGDKGEPRATPRNKTGVSEEFNASSQGPELRSGPRPLLLPAVPPSNGCASFISQLSSSIVTGLKRKQHPANFPEGLHSQGSAHYPNPSPSTSLMMRAKCIPGQPSGTSSSYSNFITDENDFGGSSFLQSGSGKNLHLQVKKEKNDNFSSKLSKEAKSGDISANPMEDNTKCDETMKSVRGDETSRLDFPPNQPVHEFKRLHKSKTVADDISALCEKRRRSISCGEEGSTRSSPRGNFDTDALPLKMGDGVKREDTSDSCSPDSIIGVDADELERLLGRRLFMKGRKTMIHQQKILSSQMFELHSLIAVQRHIARSPEMVHESTFDPEKPSIKFPPINELLYVSPLDPSPSTAKPKLDPEIEKGLLPQQKPLPNPPSLPTDPKLAPWSLPVPTGNQWLVPVRSPSEGLIYKPYHAGFMGPAYGNCGAMSLSSFAAGSTYNVPPPNAELSESYWQPYSTPMASASSLNLELDKGSSSKFIVPHQISCNAQVSECGGNLHRSNGDEMQCSSKETSPSERMEGDALSLFPTAPAIQNQQKVQAIKVVPHNRTLASASAARIFESIQEERIKKN